MRRRVALVLFTALIATSDIARDAQGAQTATPPADYPHKTITSLPGFSLAA